ncbi:MAG: hypothetical protein HC875_04535 [Anaerolineales bacterium]|nr:hypothetical protein [Anaerolineales bacterium]
MPTKPRFIFFGLIFLVTMALSGCGLNINRNADGSLTVEARMTEADLQTEIAAAIADPLLRNFVIDVQEGYIRVSAERKRLNSDQTDTLSFRLTLSASEGRLAALISEAQINNQPLDSDRVALWNERIANRLGKATQRNPDSTLQSVTMGGEVVTMVWRVETSRSRDN